jgi:hypothetical protein
VEGKKGKGQQAETNELAQVKMEQKEEVELVPAAADPGYLEPPGTSGGVRVLDLGVVTLANGKKGRGFSKRQSLQKDF